MRKGSHITEEHRQKMSLGLKGKNTAPKSEEHKQKISEGMTAYRKRVGKMKMVPVGEAKC